MFYTRFSDDEFQSDVSIHADQSGGYTTFIANCKIEIDRTELPEITASSDHPQWARQHIARQSAVRYLISHTARTKKHEHPLAGTMHFHHNASQTLELLRELQEAGFHVPIGTAEKIQGTAGSRV